MPKQLISPRFTVWSLTIMLVLVALFSAWHRIEPEANHTALEVARKRILERASFYRQQWLLAEQPSQITVNQKLIQFSPKGWVTAINGSGNLDCQHWLSVLYEEKRVLGSFANKIKANSSASSFQCDYYFNQIGVIQMELTGDKFGVSVTFTSE